jgi:hypothetical protein
MLGSPARVSAIATPSSTTLAAITAVRSVKVEVEQFEVQLADGEDVDEVEEELERRDCARLLARAD